MAREPKAVAEIHRIRKEISRMTPKQRALLRRRVRARYAHLFVSSS